MSRPAAIRLLSHSVRQSTSTGRSALAWRSSAPGKIERLLDRLPAGAAPLAMRADALRHLLVAGLGGGEIEAALADQPLGIGALAGPRAAKD